MEAFKYAAELMVHFGFDKYTDIIFGSDGANTFTKAEIIGSKRRSLAASRYNSNNVVKTDGAGLP